MKHPDREEWVPYLFGEAPAEQRKRLRAHLRECPDCGAEAEAWRRSVGRLNRWRLPRRRWLSGPMQPMVRWAVATALAVVLGAALGRWWVPAPNNVEAVRAAIEPALKAAMAQEIDRRLAVVRADTLYAATNTEPQRWDQLLQTLAAAREEDRQAVLVLFQQLKNDNDARYLSLRRDLETVASLTESELLQARQGLVRLASLARVEEPPQ